MKKVLFHICDGVYPSVVGGMEIFRDLINTFKTERVKFEIFDSFKWELKGVKDK